MDKHGTDIIDGLQGEAKTAEKTLSTEDICRKGGANLIFERLEKAYEIEKVKKLDHELEEFLDYSWNRSVSIEHLISGFHTRLDKIAELSLDEKIKGRVLLRQTDLADHDRHVVIGASSGRYEVKFVSDALRNIFQNCPPTGEAIQSRPSGPGGLSHSYPEETDIFESTRHRGTGRRNQGSRGRNYTSRHNSQQPSKYLEMPTLYTFKNSATDNSERAVVHSGEFASVVGNKSLDRALSALDQDSVQKSACVRQTTGSETTVKNNRRS